MTLYVSFLGLQSNIYIIICLNVTSQFKQNCTVPVYHHHVWLNHQGYWLFSVSNQLSSCTLVPNILYIYIYIYIYVYVNVYIHIYLDNLYSLIYTYWSRSYLYLFFAFILCFPNIYLYCDFTWPFYYLGTTLVLKWLVWQLIDGFCCLITNLRWETINHNHI